MPLGRSTVLAVALTLGLTVGPGSVATPAGAGNNSVQARCVREAAQVGLLGRDGNPGNTMFFGGSEGPDDFTDRATAGPDVFCGFGGDDSLTTLDPADVFLGGEGNDAVTILRGGTFNGGVGNDRVTEDFYGGVFNGGAGDDGVNFQYSRNTLPLPIFNGDAGDDSVSRLHGGTFNGGAGDDGVALLRGGTFNGDAGDDHVTYPSGGTFNGGEGNDSEFGTPIG